MQMRSVDEEVTMSGDISVCVSCGAKNRLNAPPPGKAPVCGRCRSALPWLVHAADADFGEVIAEPVPVLVDFWAAWCGPCRAMAPVLEELAREQAGHVKVVKLNVDDNPGTASRFEITSIPTLILFKGGRPVETMVGAVGKPALLMKILPHLPK